jgi:2-methylcitrate dehydratase PrpD
LNEGSIVPKEIKRIYVEVYEAASHLGVDLPETTEEAQFNLAWPIAALIVDGEVGPNQVLEPRLIAEEIRTIASRIELSISDELTKWYELAEVGHNDGKDAAFISIELIDGTIHDAGLSIAPTYSDQIWGRSEMENKFRWLLDPIIPEPELSDLVAMIWSFDQLDDIAELMNLISGLKLGIDNPVLT